MEIFSYFASFDGKEQIKIEMKFKLIVENGDGIKHIRRKTYPNIAKNDVHITPDDV